MESLAHISDPPIIHLDRDNPGKLSAPIIDGDFNNVPEMANRPYAQLLIWATH
jgi:hypothetical protein